MKLIDPGRGKMTREIRKQTRLSVFKRAANQTNRNKETAERKQDWEVRYGISDNTK